MTLSPIAAFDDLIRPAKLLLNLYRLLDADDRVLREGEIVERLRTLVGANPEEELLVVHHLMATAVVRDRAGFRSGDLRRAALKNLLRQAIVTSCTALDVFLPALLTANLSTVIAVVGRRFFPTDDNTVSKYFEPVKFSVQDVLSFQERTPEGAAEFVANRLTKQIEFSYLSNARGVHITGALLQIKEPWTQLGAHLGDDSKALRSALDLTTDRRNDIIHRADRARADREAEAQQEIEYSQAFNGVTVIEKVCRALDELVKQRLKEIESVVAP
jgi:hypothetical protein